MKPVVQVALDLTEVDQAIGIAEQVVKEGVEWIEAGTPLIKSVGIGAVKLLKRAFPDQTIVADMKIADAGGLEVKLARRAGADVVSVLGSAADVTIAEASRTSRRLGAKLLVDLLAVQDLEARARQVERLGADYLCVHVGLDQQRLGIKPLEALEKVVSLTRLPTAVAGGITAKTAPELVKRGASIIVVGGAIVRARSPAKAAREIVSRVKGVRRWRDQR